ncbi:pentatricopeptide repeat-containing protein At4g19191, mitochondrial isoform X3 [Neltuma alba]|uniref:pentatricopeptide repeat-containing protein At4g19191, mitochondrial isoform X3 n=1 Tax=Neltuma alba TaxID=207710 RepID=UPI0010A54B11|nr:pentatricopeptide repeat-containing protein At4g19191, mitochondrial isoform X3 [Prosopis alba]
MFRVRFSVTPHLTHFSNFSTIGLWNSYIREAVNQGHAGKALVLCRQMKQNGIQPNNSTFPFVAKACAKLLDIKQSQIIHALVAKSRFQSNVFVQTAMVDMYIKCDQLEDAYNVFVEMPTRDVASWNAILLGFAQAGFLDRVSCLLHQMRISGTQPDSVTALALTHAVLITKDPRFVGSIHSFGIRIGTLIDVSVANTLIAAYAKCDDLVSAETMFDETDVGLRSVVSWNSMIAAYSNFEKHDGALCCYKEMLDGGFFPDISTILNLLSSIVQPKALFQGCGQTGALELGKWLHTYSISKGLKDDVVVCNALIDMYAKCGSINKARELFYNLTDKTVVSWTTIITACALNGYVNEALGLFSMMVDLGMRPNHITFLAILQACVHGGLLEKGLECFTLMAHKYGIYPSIDHYSCMVDLLGRRGQLKEALEIIKTMPFEPDAGIWSALLSACKLHRNMAMARYVFERLCEMDAQGAVPYVEMANSYASAGIWDGVAAVRRKMKNLNVKKSPGQSIVQVNGKSNVFTVEDRDHPQALYVYDMLDGLLSHCRRMIWTHSDEVSELEWN